MLICTSSSGVAITSMLIIVHCCGCLLHYTEHSLAIQIMRLVLMMSELWLQLYAIQHKACNCTLLQQVQKHDVGWHCIRCIC